MELRRQFVAVGAVFLLATIAAVVLLKTNESVSVAILGENTVYSISYVEDEFRQVDVGDSKEKVRSLLGEPLRVVAQREEPSELWVYSASGAVGKTQNFRIRIIDFNRAGFVSGKETGLYVD